MLPYATVALSTLGSFGIDKTFGKGQTSTSQLMATLRKGVKIPFKIIRTIRKSINSKTNMGY